jgi:hypothetical protein
MIKNIPGPRENFPKTDETMTQIPRLNIAMVTHARDVAQTRVQIK